MRKILFRFFFIYFLFTISPWQWFGDLPGISFLIELYGRADAWIVEFFNKNLLHVKEVLNINGGGSGDTSYAWAQFYTYLIIAFIGCIIWTWIDRKKQNNYNTLAFWTRNFVRYYVALVSFSYGIIKLFALQMYFPNLSQLATPLGDYLPMRFSWMFIGYSTPYQVFSGVTETLVGILLLNRKTVIPGALVGVAVFTNVFMLNISYDVPVKLYSMQLLICCLFLVAEDWRRLFSFFIQNKNTAATSLYHIDLRKRWQRIGRWVWKIAFIIVFAIIPFSQSWERYRNEQKVEVAKGINKGIYDIRTFVKNNDTIPISGYDEMVWKDFIFDKNGGGSINTSDSLFRQRYRRGYFMYEPDTLKRTIVFKKFPADSLPLFELNYKIIDDNHLNLWGKVRNDSVYFGLVKNNRHFQLAEKQFHWISEANR